MCEIIGIMAATKDGVIGNNNSLPWHYPDELEYFRKITKDQVIVLGRKTFDSMPRNLFDNRLPIIFSRTKSNSNYQTVSSIEDFLSLAKFFAGKKINMIGGAEIAHLFLKENLLSSFLLTQINHQYIGDTYLDLKLFSGWQQEIVKTNAHYTIIKFNNPKSRQLC